MGIEKEGSKSGGGYAGGFFQLFDWTAKSRKKLFSSKSDLPEPSQRGTKGDGSFPRTHVHLMDQNESVAGSSIKGSGDCSCSSSVTDDEGYGTKAPGVVARLMGLDSLPTSSFSEPYSTPLFDTQSLRSARYHRKISDSCHDNKLIYSGNLPNKEGAPARIPYEPKPHKILNRPMEKFQTEILPPKAAKSIPITHHRLLSPIKSPCFVPSKNAAHIMEVAAKIIDPGPLAPTKAKVPLVGSSSVPLKVQAPKDKVLPPQKLPQVGSSSASLKVKDFKEKVEVANKSYRLSEASRRAIELDTARILKGEPMNKSWNGSLDASFRASGTDENGSKSKGRSVSLAIQAKVNVQRREGSSASGSRSFSGQKELSEVKLSQPVKNQRNIQQSLHMKPSSRQTASNVLRHNNQKQNRLVDRDRLPSKSSVSDFQGKKPVARDSSILHKKGSGRATATGKSKIGVRKSGSEITDGEKEDLYYRVKNFPRKKRSIDRDSLFDKSQVVDNVLTNKKQTPLHSNSIVDRKQPYSWVQDSIKQGTDVVSFTFTTPLTRPTPGSEISGQIAQDSYSLCTDHWGKRVLHESDSMKLSSVGYNVIGDSPLSALLEQKLKELTNRVESPHQDSIKQWPASVSAYLEGVNAMPGLNEKGNSHVLDNDEPVIQYDSDFSSNDSPMFRFQHKFEEVAEMEECGSSTVDSGKLSNYRHPSPISILEPSFSSESCVSSVTADSQITEGSKLLCSSVQAQDVGLNSSNIHSVQADKELLDSASSLSTGVVVRKNITKLTVTDLVGSNDWELEYVKVILVNTESMLKELILGSCEIINPNVFDLLETRKGGSVGGGSESRLKRKVLFDCVCECLDLRCSQYMCGGYRMWEKAEAKLRRKDWLAEEIYKEISGWKGLGNCMVDELVDKDMSSHNGRWLNFEADAFVLEEELGDHIFISIVDEVLADFSCDCLN